MDIIVKEIDKNNYSKFAISYEYNSFLNSVEMEKISDLRKHPSLYLGFYDNNKIIGVSRFIITSSHNKKSYYAVRGPLIDYSNDDLVTSVMISLKKYLKEHNGYLLKIDPAISYILHDIDGKVVDDNSNNDHIINTLKNIGFKHQGFNIYYDYSKQNRWEFVLDIKNKSIDDIYKGLKPNHRNIINKTKTFGISIEELKYDELPIYKKITEDTADRRGFSDLNLDYYQTVYNSFKDNSKFKFLVAYLYPKEYRRILEEQLKNATNTYNRKQSSNCSKGELNEAKVTVDSLTKRLDFAKTLKEDKIPLSAALFIIYGKTAYYMSSGSYKEYMNFYAQYAIQWYMLNYAVEQKLEKFNFMGIIGDFNKTNPEYGVYEFKKGFGGNVVEYIGEFHLPLSTYYYIVNIKNKLRKIIKK